ncbi:universal stress protein [Agrococcus carbonis]|uniref:Nucleotide-binding universal stress protein, UspA family n=1 Tax=Agrococcus carbonis TaxID=684552 RepID=A0A1H1MXI1_9MICO|nr:universal stress protein [Agrococcus carbonis]SDR91380.1 Nucleotide-binding universal stress protein, UspA family [Agrococcus carbonis]
MFSSIIVGWDGSTASQAALDWAATIALDRPLVLLHAMGGTPKGSDYLSATSERSAQRVGLMEVADAVRLAHPGIRVETETVQGAALDELGRRLAEDALVVVGGPDAGIRSPWTLGARLAGRPGRRAVAVVPVDAPAVRPSALVVGIDGTAEARAALELAIAEADALGASVRIVHAWDVPAGWSHGFGEYPTQADIDVLEDIHRELLEDAVEFAGSLGARVESRLEMGPAAEVLRQEGDSALVVVASHAAGGLARFFLGSVSHDLVVRPKGPVLVLGT